MITILTPVESGQIRHKTPRAQALERIRGKGPKYIRDGRKIFYLLKDIEEYIEANRRNPDGTLVKTEKANRGARGTKRGSR